MELEAINAHDVITFAGAIVGEDWAIENILPIFGYAVGGAYWPCLDGALPGIAG